MTVARTDVYSDPAISTSVIAVQINGAVGTLIEGPVAADGVNWWLIDYDTAPSGWSVEDSLILAPTLDIAANTWIEVQPNFQGAPNGGQLYPQGWANKATYDPLAHRVIFSDRWYDTIRGTSIFANGIYGYDPATNNFSVLKLNNWYAQSITCNNGQQGCYTTSPLPEEASDPTPPDHHPLSAIEVVPSQNALYSVNGVNSYLADVSILNATWKLNLDTNQWQRVSTASTDPNYPPNNGGSPSGLVYDTSIDKLIQFVPGSCGCSGTATYLFDPATNLWAAVPQESTAISVYIAGAAVAYDSRRSRVITLGGNNYITSAETAKTWSYNAAQNQWTRLSDAPVASMAATMAYDSRHDVFLALIGNNTYLYNPATDVWTQYPATLYRPATFQQWQAISYDPAHDVFVYEGGTAGTPQIALFRYDPNFAPNLTFDTTPPTVAITAPLSGATVSGQVPITIQSTDALIPNSNNTVGMMGVQLQVDGSDVGSIMSGQGPTYQYVLNTANFLSGPHSLSAVAIDAVGNKAESSISITIPNAGPPPVLAGISATSKIPSNAAIGWITDIPADSQVVYGLTSDYGLSSPLLRPLVTSHLVSLPGLSPSTTYHYQIRSRNSHGDIALSDDLMFTTASPAQPLLQIIGDASELSALTSGAIVTPEIAPPGFIGTVVKTGLGSVNFAAALDGNGVYFLNCCDNANDAYYRFSGRTVGNIFSVEQGQISFYLKSRYSFSQRQASAASPRYVFDVRDDDLDNHIFSFTVQVSSGRLLFGYQTGSKATQFYYVPQGVEDSLFGDGVTMKVAIAWDGTQCSLYLNDTLVQSSTYSKASPNWTSASVFAFGAYDYVTYGGFNSSDDIIDEFTVLGRSPFNPTRPNRPTRP